MFLVFLLPLKSHASQVESKMTFEKKIIHLEIIDTIKAFNVLLDMRCVQRHATRFVQANLSTITLVVPVLSPSIVSIAPWPPNMRDEFLYLIYDQ